MGRSGQFTFRHVDSDLQGRNQKGYYVALLDRHISFKMTSPARLHMSRFEPDRAAGYPAKW